MATVVEPNNWGAISPLRDFQIKKYPIVLEAGSRGQGAGEGKVVVKPRNWIIDFLEFFKCDVYDGLRLRRYNLKNTRVDFY